MSHCKSSYCNTRSFQFSFKASDSSKETQNKHYKSQNLI